MGGMAVRDAIGVIRGLSLSKSPASTSKPNAERRFNMPLVEMQPNEVRDIFLRLESDEALVLCVGSLFGASFTVAGKISVTGRTVVVRNPKDVRCSVELHLDTDDLAFMYGEPKDFPVEVPEHAKSAATVCVGLPFRPFLAEAATNIVSRREKMFFVELIEERET